MWMLKQMYSILPITNDPRQVFTLDMEIDGEPFHTRVEIRYLPAPDCWVISLWDNSSGELLVNQIPLVCSYGEVNDLLRPFRHLREGQGMGSLFVIRDNSSGELLVSQVPLVCSYGRVNDLLRPFRHLRDGRGLGSLFVIRDTDEPSAPDPAEGNLTAFRILFGRTIDD